MPCATSSRTSRSRGVSPSSLGAAAGSSFALVCNALAPGLALDPTAFAIVGMSTFFAAVIRAPFTGMLLIVEMTATTSQVIPMLAAMGAAVAVATAMRAEPIYDTLRFRMLAAGTGVSARDG